MLRGPRLSPKTTKNICITLQSMWTTARAWGYVAHNLMEGVVLPDVKRIAAQLGNAVWGVLDPSWTLKEHGSGVESPKPLYLN
jgi:hypothetical protein